MNFLRLAGCMGVVITLSSNAADSRAHQSMDPDMWMAPEQQAHLVNPLAADEKSVASGRDIYLRNCSSCHGENAEGLDAQIVGLEKSPPNLKERVKMHPDGDFFWKIQEGRGDMPSFKDDLTDEQVWGIINYIRSEAK